MKFTTSFCIGAMAAMCCLPAAGQDFRLNNDSSYFRHEGVDVISFYDYYPEGHQGGVSILMNGRRVATNGDVRFEATPGQWQPVPKLLKREVHDQAVTATLAYPDSARHLTGFNPMIYPDVQLQYTVRTEAVGNHIEVTVDLQSPIPEAFVGKAGFNLELYPTDLFGRPWLMDAQAGIYPRQANGPLQCTQPNYLHTGNFHPEGEPLADIHHLIPADSTYSPIVADDVIGEPYAVGRKFVSRPDDPLRKLTVESLTGDLKLYDGRINHNNGWFVLRTEIPAGATRGAVKWIITPNVVKGWRYQPVVQTSQVGYHPLQPKVAVVECDRNDSLRAEAEVVRLEADGERVVKRVRPEEWGEFLRYRYAKVDFSDVSLPGLYQIRYGEGRSSVFRVDSRVYDRGVWQPVVEYFLPNQMCHMRVNEKYRVWHGLCHMDDARMAQNTNAFDGYVQQSGLSPFQPGDRVDGVAVGGWHDAGDYDLRIESQAGEAYILAMTYEQFRPQIDVTAIDQAKHLTEIHQPDGQNDILQQIEHGALSVVAAYKALGRPYRGIICNRLRQYVMLGDAAAMTDGQAGNDDDRWIYTEDNPMRDVATAASLAGVSRVLGELNDTLAAQCLEMAENLFAAVKEGTTDERMQEALLYPAAELYLTTGATAYRDFLLAHQPQAVQGVAHTGWFLARIAKRWEGSRDRRERAFAQAFRAALPAYREELERTVNETPYGVPYRPNIWGAGWDIQRFGYQHYFLASAYPEIFSAQPIMNALNFVLGCHPGSNTASFASGIGAVSATTAYGTNRGDWSYVPGGVVSGTAIIRPDFPELLEFPFLWQQTEYVLGGGSSHYMFLVLAVQKILNGVL